MAQQFLLEAPSLEEARAKALREHGPSARIVKAERVYDRGLSGLLGRRHVEATVEVPDPEPAPPVPHELAERPALAALLAEADAADAVVVPGLGPVHLSTGEARFEDVLRSLAAETAPGAEGPGEGEPCSS